MSEDLKLETQEVEAIDTIEPTAATTEHIGDECLLILCSQLPDKSTDELIAEFAIEPMRDYLTRARRDRQRALHGTYPTTRQPPSRLRLNEAYTYSTISLGRHSRSRQILDNT